MKKLFLLLFLAGCGSGNDVKFPSSGCGEWKQVEINNCGGKWVQACNFDGLHCVYNWDCGYKSGPMCVK